LERKTTDQEVLGSTPSRRTKKKVNKMINWINKMSLQKAVIYFFILIFFVLLVITVFL
jgi:hypothetical protein